jgi:hypothetical protein
MEILRRLPYVIALWTGAGFFAWWLDKGAGASGWLIGMFSGVDYYQRLQRRKRTLCYLLFTLGMFGIPFGILYEGLLSLNVPLPPLGKVSLFGTAVGGLFAVVTQGVVRLLGVPERRNNRSSSPPQQGPPA